MDSSDKKNTGRQYEQLVRDIYQGILLLHGDEFKNIAVECNKRLDSMTSRNPDGTALQREIDVYWEYELAGIQFKVCVQAKDLTRKVNLGMVDTFRAVLLDISGQPRGVMVTRKGYQKGADTHARSYGIEIIQLSELELEASPSSIEMSIAGWFCQPLGLRFEFDDDYIKEHKICGVNIPIHKNVEKSFLYLEDGSPYISIADSLKLPEPKDFAEGVFLTENWFEQSVFLHTDDPVHPRLKVSGVVAELSIRRTFKQIDIKTFVAHNFQSLTGNTSYWVDNAGKVIRAGELLSVEQEVTLISGEKVKLTIKDEGVPSLTVAITEDFKLPPK
ncbi:MAG: restriction endonuclease [Candidatus Obscuribacterales bacterium]